MNWNYRKWKAKTRIIGVLIIFIISLLLLVSKGYAEETVSGHIQEAVFDTLAGTVALAGAVEQAAIGNFVTGAALSVLASREFYTQVKSKIGFWQRRLGSKFSVLVRALPPGNGRLLRTQKFAPPSCQIPNF